MEKTIKYKYIDNTFGAKFVGRADYDQSQLRLYGNLVGCVEQLI